MKSYKLKLVGFPEFYIEDLGESEKENKINFNEIFWNTFFSKEILNLANIKKLSSDEIDNLRFIIKNIELVKKIFILSKEKDIKIYHILFAFNIINSFIDIINNNLEYEKFAFYDYTKYKNGFKENIEKTLIYNFFSNNLNKLNNIENNSTIKLDIVFSEELLQLEILKYFILKSEKKIKIEIQLSYLKDFENKVVFGKIIKNIFKDTGIKVEISISGKDNNIIENKKKYLGHNDIRTFIFNKGCYYRKCKFCNYGKFSNKIKNPDLVIDKLIELNKNGKFDTLHILDPDIQLEEILYVSRKFRENNTKIKIHIKTRYKKEYTLSVLKELYKGGVRFLGFGLESASKRVNNLIDKYEDDVTIENFNNFIKNCEEAGIGIHVYSIIGLPTETIEETELTKNFLLENLNKYPFFTYTAGTFGLNKGSYIYNHPEEFGINFSHSDLLDISIFISDYNENISKETKNYRRIIAKELKYKMLFKNPKMISISSKFWHFIENSGLFHIYKLYYIKNPFLNFWEKNNIVNKENYLNKKYERIEYYQQINNKEVFRLKNWINLTQIDVNLNIITFLNEYNSNLDLKQNSKGLDNNELEIVYKLIKNYFLILKK